MKSTATEEPKVPIYWTYIFPDAEEDGAAKLIRFHSDRELTDEEVADRKRQYNATRVIGPRRTYGAPRMTAS
jgi:hypothetical protein